MNINRIKEKSREQLRLLPSYLHKAGYSFTKWLKKTFLTPSDAMKTAYCLIIVAVLCYGYTWVNEKFTVPLSGDYSLQEMTFIFNGYDDWHSFFRTGVFPQWDRTAFLGIDNIGGNSFYYLFDPFLLILLPFPRTWLLQLQGLEFVLKMGLAGMFFYWYLGEFKLSPSARRIGAIAFAFSGYSFNYLWFHFIDSVAFYPLVLLGAERLIKERDPRIFLVGFFLNAMTSYFFFVVFMFGAFFYAIFRFFQTMKDRDFDGNWAVLGLGIFSFLVAVFLGCFTLLPGMVTATSMPRVSSSSSYLSNITSSTSISEMISAIFSYDTTSGTAHITPLLNFLFINDDCYSSNLLNVYFYDNFQSSLYATTPMLLLFFVSFIDSVREHRLDRLFAVIFTTFLIFTPIGFYLFSGFTVGYARYFIIPISWMIVYDCIAFEKRRDIPRTYLDISFVILAILMALCCYLMVDFVDDNPTLFSGTEWDTKMILIPASMVWLCVCYAVMRPFFHKRHFSKAMLGLTAIDIIVMANCTIYFHGISGIIAQSDEIDEETKIVQLLKADENNDDYYRIYNTTADRGNINISFREGYDGLGAFHSVYAFEAQDFIDRSRIPYSYHNWSMGIHNRRYNLETFLGTKYYLVQRVGEKSDYYGIPQCYPYTNSNGYPDYAEDYDIPYGYKDVLTLTDEEKAKLGVNYSSELLDFLASDECNKTLYINTDFVDFAFPFDTVINSYWLANNLSYKSEDEDPNYNCYEDYNEYPLLRAAMLDDEDYQKFYEEKKYNAGTFVMNGVTYTYTGTTAQNASKFQRDLYTSVPYEKGVTSPIEVYKSNDNSFKNKMKVTIYAANWPATEDNANGVYASCYEDDPHNGDCLTEYMKTNPVEYANGIRPADTKYDYETLKDDNGEKKDTYSRKVLYNTKIVITPVDPVTGEETTFASDANPDDPTTGCYISIFDQDQIEWRLIDSTGSVISYAMHSYSDYKQAHGYYTDRPVAKIIGILKAGSKDSPINLKRPYVYVQRNSDYQEAIDALRAEPIDITYRVDDEVDFTTNYSKDKFVVLNYPKASGWKLKEITYNEKKGEDVESEVTIYKAQGGFIGFEAEAGEHRYVLVYSSPYFKLGEFITFVGLVITIGCFIFFGRKKRNEHGLDDVVSLNKSKEEAILVVMYKYDNFEEHIK